MDAVFTLPYSEFAVAELFIEVFKARDGYSVCVPVSRTEIGVDLVLTRRSGGVTKAVTFQIKSSRTYAGTAPKRKVKHRRYRHYTWLNSFKVPEQADFVVFFGLYPQDERNGNKTNRSWWQQHVLVFSHEEATNLLTSLRTRGGKPDSKFGFGFDSSDEAYLTRGSETGEHIDYSKYLFKHQVSSIRQALGHDYGNTRQASVAARGDRQKFERAMGSVPDAEPEEFDRL